jgi:Cu(I)/Ag(I) efflux system membrane fusion protein
MKSVQRLYSQLVSLLSRRKALVGIALALLAFGGAYLTSSFVRANTNSAWRATLQWVGIGAETVDSDKVFWCPMDPQIKSKKENAVCPICNMALVELEGGVVEAPDHLTLTAQQIQQAGVVTMPVIRRKLYREIDTTGRIDYDERRYAGISSWVRGKSRIDRLHVNFTGDTVKEGEVVAEIYSPELISTQEEFLIALRNAENSTGGRSSRIGLDPVDYVASARQKLIYQGLTPAQVDELQETRTVLDRIPVFAPISGTVIERHVQQMQYVQEGDWLLHLADLSHLWLYVDIFEDEEPLIEPGMPVELSVGKLPGETFWGKVAFVEPRVRPETRTIPVRIDIDNRDGKLFPGMYARARVRHDFPSVLAVPDSAVLWSGQRAIVITKGIDGAFQPREVALGRKWLFAAEDEAGADKASLGFGADRLRFHEVLQGLAPGDQVVTSGAFLLNAESQFQSVLAKMLPPESDGRTLEQLIGKPLAAQSRELLDAYFQLSATLAEDRIDDVSIGLKRIAAQAEQLAQATADADHSSFAEDAGRFSILASELSAAPVSDARDARTRFGRLSRELTELLEAHGGKTLFGKELYQFECGMAKVGYERWLWWSPEIHNPYMGQKMLDCGKKLDVFEP